MSRVPLKTQIRSALRRIWLYSDVRREAMGNARVARGVYRCSACSTLVGPKLIDVDHKVSVTPPNFDPDTYPEQWGSLIKRLLYVNAKDDLRVMCKPCHKARTTKERQDAKQNIKKKTRKKKPKRANKLRAPRNERIHKKRT